ncbi:MAG: hypothetical protein F9K23_16905 [Bacteroidetes bacterium]|nr:MAG: hypothetical protein F9K23_16905 [Bacteroidota bacterium]
MNMRGKWVGWYAYNNKKIDKIRGVDKTMFSIYIDTVNGNKFYGTVEDDKNTLGMEGIGRIEGTVEGNVMSFTKKMPFRTLLIRGERVIDKSKKHPTVYYKGTGVNDNSFKGEWKFKFGLTFIGMMPAILLPIKGTWEMKRETDIVEP